MSRLERPLLWIAITVVALLLVRELLGAIAPPLGEGGPHRAGPMGEMADLGKKGGLLHL